MSPLSQSHHVALLQNGQTYTKRVPCFAFIQVAGGTRMKKDKEEEKGGISVWLCLTSIKFKNPKF